MNSITVMNEPARGCGPALQIASERVRFSAMISSRVLAFLSALLVAGAAVPAHGEGVYLAPGPWLDDTAHVFPLAALNGTYTVVTMAYGACQRVCSTSVRRIEELHDLAERRHIAVNFVVFGLDPDEDRPQDWAAFRAERHLSYRNLQFLSGSPGAVRRLANSLGVRYWRYDGHTLHDFRMVLLSPSGHIVRSIDRFDGDISALLP